MPKEAPELLKAVEHLSRGEIAEGVALLEQQGRVTEIGDAQKRIAAIARSYAASPDNTIVVSPDNASRRQINQAVRSELQALGTVASEDHAVRVLAPRSDMTGADRTWAARYAVDDVLYYPPGSQDIGIERQSYTKVIATQPNDNLLTVEKEDGVTVTYNPSRLYGVNVYRELEREFAVGDRLSFTAPSRELGVANRDLGTVQQIDNDGQLSVKMDNGKSVSFDPNQMRHFDHGYAVTSHSSQGLTAGRVMVNVDSHTRPTGESPYTLLDDLTAAALARLAAEGYGPAAVVETSPDSFQAWLRHTQPLSKELGTLAAKTLADEFGADRSAADWRRFRRAPGFTNRKLQHRNAQNLYPFARLHSATGQMFAVAEPFRLRITALYQKAEQENATARNSFASRPTRYAAPVTLSRFRTSARYIGRPAAADMAFCIAACSQGWTESDIAAALSCEYLSRATSRTRQAAYIRRTLEKPSAGSLEISYFPTLLLCIDQRAPPARQGPFPPLHSSLSATSHDTL